MQVTWSRSWQLLSAEDLDGDDKADRLYAIDHSDYLLVIATWPGKSSVAVLTSVSMVSCFTRNTLGESISTRKTGYDLEDPTAMVSQTLTISRP